MKVVENWAFCIFRLRHQCSSLNDDQHRVNIKLGPKCRCNLPFEDAIHYLFEFPLYLNERTQLFSELSEIDLIFEILLFGNDDYDNASNSGLCNLSRKFIKQSKRFNLMPLKQVTNVAAKGLPSSFLIFFPLFFLLTMYFIICICVFCYHCVYFLYIY